MEKPKMMKTKKSREGTIKDFSPVRPCSYRCPLHPNRPSTRRRDVATVKPFEKRESAKETL